MSAFRFARGLALAALTMAGCAKPAETPAPQAHQRAANRAALDSLASWRVPMTAEFYQGLRGWSFRDSVPLALGSRSRSVLSTAGVVSALDSVAEGEVLSFAPNGTAIGRMQMNGEVVNRFVLTSAQGRTLWTHDPPGRGHHFYQIGPDGRMVIGHSSSTAHPGKPGTVGTLTFYDSLGRAGGQYSCSMLGGSEISPDAAVTLVECRDSALVVVDRQGGTLATLAGSFRNFRISNGGRVIAAVPIAQPRSLQLLAAVPDFGARQPRLIELPQPVRQVALSSDGEMVVATAGAEVVATNPASGAELWRVRLDGQNPLPTSLSLGPGGLVAVGAVQDGALVLADGQGPHPALVAVIQNGRLLRTLQFELDSLNAWVPSVALDPAGRALLIWEPTGAWRIDLARLGRQERGR